MVKRTEAEPPAGKPSKMSFNQYMTALGSSSESRLSQQTGIPHDVIERALRGVAIPGSSAKLIIDWIGRQFERDIGPEHVTDLPTVNPGRERPIALPPASEPV